MRFQIKHQNIIGKSRERLWANGWKRLCAKSPQTCAEKNWASGKMEKSKKNQLPTLSTSIIPLFHPLGKNSIVKTSKSKTIWPLLGRTEKTENDFSVISRERKTKGHMTHSKEAGKSKRMQNITFLLLLPKKIEVRNLNSSQQTRAKRWPLFGWVPNKLP